MVNVVVIDYGTGNIKSIQRGLEKVGASVTLSSLPEVIISADHLVLPGVGAFEVGMRGLNKTGVIPAINEFILIGKPFLGICLGMQMLLEYSYEFGSHKGLGYIPGVVKEIPQRENGIHVRKTPHIGWNALFYPKHNHGWNNSILNGLIEGEYFYFLHSFMVDVQSSSDLLAECDYEGIKITAAIKKENITGLQFHPEKSGKCGLRILKSFVYD